MFTQKHLLTSIFLMLLFSFAANAQQRNCSTMEVLDRLNQEDPNTIIEMERIESFTQKILENKSDDMKVNGTITIPVVVHVIYSNNQENISEAQINSQMQVLNDDFRRLNSDADNTWSQAADTEIEFCLASVDPNGNATTGITRKSSTKTSWGTNDAMKSAAQGGVAAWPASDYLNMWICNIGGGILGYAQFPGGSAATDGVVMSPQYFGTTGYVSAPFDGGRTTTHEVGHWLNLRHIWGDGNCNADDFVSDTPTSDGANYGCATGHVSCSSTDMVQNYMDYSDDACMNLYTQGQTDRMRALFASGGFRASLLNSGGCGSGGNPPPPPPTGCDDTEVAISFNFDSYSEETSWQITDDSGAVVASGGNYGAGQSAASETACLADGCYNFTINDSYGDGICCSYGNGSYTVTGGGSTLAAGGEFTTSETTNFCIGGGDPPPPPPSDECASTSEDFEGGWGIWNDGGSDAARSSSSTYASSGSYSMRIRDNTSTSVVTTDNLDLSAYATVTVDFHYMANSMENGEDFWLQFSLDGGATFQTVEDWARGTDFNNNTSYNESVTVSISGGGTFASNTQVRFRCDASGNADYVYIDDVVITACQSARMAGENVLFIDYIDASAPFIANNTRITGDVVSSLNVYPNPAKDVVRIDYQIADSQEANLAIYDLSGKLISTRAIIADENLQTINLDVSGFNSGMYYLNIVTNNERLTKKLMIVD